MKNYVELSGRVYNTEIRTTASGKTVTRFGLSVWAGKDKEGKNIYHFVNCKYWGDLGSETNINIVGKIAFDTWEKDGKQNVKMYVLVDSISIQNTQSQPQQTEQGDFGW